MHMQGYDWLICTRDSIFAHDHQALSLRVAQYSDRSDLK
jgi:hypothetical protein